MSEDYYYKTGVDNTVIDRIAKLITKVEKQSF